MEFPYVPFGPRVHLFWWAGLHLEHVVRSHISTIYIYISIEYQPWLNIVLKSIVGFLVCFCFFHEVSLHIFLLSKLNMDPLVSSIFALALHAFLRTQWYAYFVSLRKYIYTYVGKYSYIHRHRIQIVFKCPGVRSKCLCEPMHSQ